MTTIPRRKRLALACVLIAGLGPAIAAEPAGAAPPAATAGEAPTPTPAPDCIRDTGTRIKLPPGACVSQAGHVHQAKDLESTGATSVGDALRQLDPTILGPGRR